MCKIPIQWLTICANVQLLIDQTIFAGHNLSNYFNIKIIKISIKIDRATFAGPKLLPQKLHNRWSDHFFSHWNKSCHRPKIREIILRNFCLKLIANAGRCFCVKFFTCDSCSHCCVDHYWDLCRPRCNQRQTCIRHAWPLAVSLFHRSTSSANSFAWICL